MQRIALFIVGALRALVGLALVAGALVIGFVLAAGLLLRLAWRRARAAGGRRPTVARGRAGADGEVIDVEVRELGAREITLR